MEMNTKLKDVWFNINQSQWYGAIKPYIMMISNLVLLFTLPAYGFLWLGIWGFFLGLFLFAAIKILLMRKLFMGFVRDTESKLFGKPLDKDQWEKGEFKKPKIVWKKSKEKKDE